MYTYPVACSLTTFSEKRHPRSITLGSLDHQHHRVRMSYTLHGRRWARGTGAHHGAGAPASSIRVQTSCPKQRNSSLRPVQLSQVSGSLDPRQVLFSLRLLLRANRDPPLQRADGGDGHDLGSPCRGGVR